ncbi:hypothetical protein ABK905_10640 [Acerihabitans sp. KWT182]|uniref:Pentapeptide repeat-containing protein n=1 Tax=Acerihabitans sp. KWT182 TaxID=3157919 RepID=A0AAU7QDM7_9GAMM
MSGAVFEETDLRGAVLDGVISSKPDISGV